VIDSLLVSRKLSELHERVKRIHGLRGKPVQELMDNALLRSAFERDIQIAAQIVLDLSAHILVGSGLSPGEDDHDTLLGVGRHGIVPLAFAERIASWAGIRNLLVHGYVEIDPKILHAHLQEGWKDFCDFAGYLKSFMDNLR
jgi:uncharacterized protein YutE (UPF0331/DUF86 family)